MTGRAYLPVTCSMAELVRMVTDPTGDRWTVYEGPAPREASARHPFKPFVCVYRLSPTLSGASMAGGDLGRGLDRIRFMCFGTVQDQAHQLRNRLLDSTSWPESFALGDELGDLVPDTTDDPPLWFADFVMTITYE